MDTDWLRRYFVVSVAAARFARMLIGRVGGLTIEVLREKSVHIRALAQRSV